MTISPTLREHILQDSDVIVSKTDLKGRITYTNHIFRQISQFKEEELLGKSHNIIRHPDMPRCVFKLLWQQLQAGQEIFAYVKNICKNGDFYWVFAHVTPTIDDAGHIQAYHSLRRKPKSASIQAIEPLYQKLIAVEKNYNRPKESLEKSYELLRSILQDQAMSYDEFVFSI